MTLIKFLLFIRARGAIESCLFVASFFIMFPTALSYFHPAIVRLVFDFCMGGFSIIRSRRNSCAESEGVVKVLTDFSEAT